MLLLQRWIAAKLVSCAHKGVDRAGKFAFREADGQFGLKSGPIRKRWTNPDASSWPNAVFELLEILSVLLGCSRVLPLSRCASRFLDSKVGPGRAPQHSSLFAHTHHSAYIVRAACIRMSIVLGVRRVVLICSTPFATACIRIATSAHTSHACVANHLMCALALLRLLCVAVLRLFPCACKIRALIRLVAEIGVHQNITSTVQVRSIRTRCCRTLLTCRRGRHTRGAATTKYGRRATSFLLGL